MPASTLDSVVLPAPFSPRSAWTSPRRSSSSTSTRAGTPSKLFVMWRATTAGSAACPPAAFPGSALDAGHTLDGPVDEVRLLGVERLAVGQPLRSRVVDDRSRVGVQGLVEELRAQLVDRRPHVFGHLVT